MKLGEVQEELWEGGRYDRNTLHSCMKLPKNKQKLQRNTQRIDIHYSDPQL